MMGDFTVIMRPDKTLRIFYIPPIANHTRGFTVRDYTNQ